MYLKVPFHVLHDCQVKIRGYRAWELRQRVKLSGIKFATIKQDAAFWVTCCLEPEGVLIITPWARVQFMVLILRMTLGTANSLVKKGVSLEVNKKFTSSFLLASSQGEDTFIRSSRRGDVSFRIRNL